MKRVLLVLLSACGDNAAGVDAALPARCSASFSGNFVQASNTAANCPTLETAADGTTSLAFTLYAKRLEVPLTVSIALATPPAVADYSSESVTTWSASAYARDLLGGTGVCELRGGNSAVPQGNFTLTVDALADATAHGTLALELYVLALPNIYCGAADTETVQLTF